MNKKIFHIDEDIKNTLIQTFSFDHNLASSELLDLEENATIYKNVNHIYFKDNIDLDNIYKIKSMLETSKTIDDKKIEKYILIDYSKEDLNKLLDINYLNPDTWKIYYLRTDGVKDIYSVTECRKLIKYLNSLDINNLSLIEKICYIYDKVKLLDYKNNKNTLLEILEEGYTNSYGYSLLFQEYLNVFNIKSYIEKVKSNDENRYITVINIDDSKYDIHGIYLFDPFMDSLPKGEYDEYLRRINYNYFLLSIDLFHNSIYNDSITGILKIFYTFKEDMFKDHLEELYLYDKKDIDKFIKVFGNNYLNLFQKIKNTKEIDSITIFNIVENTLKKENLIDINMKIIKENYNIKHKEMYGN